MGFICQRSRIVAIAVVIAFGAAVIAVARPHPHSLAGDGPFRK